MTQMLKKISILLAGLTLVSCANIVDQTSEAYRSEYCTFDSVSFEYYPPGSGDHQWCLDLWESGFDPDDIMDKGDN